MKILILNYEFSPLGGGAGNATEFIARELTRLGNTVTVVTSWFTGLPEKEVRDGYEIIRLHVGRSRKDRAGIFEMFRYVISASLFSRRFAKTDRPGHALCFFAVPTGVIGWYLKKFFGIPYTVSLRGGDVPGFLPKELKTLHALTMPFTRRIWKNADYIVANSNGLTELAMKTACPLGKEVLCIPNGVDTERFKPGVLEAGIASSILFVGRLTQQKGLTYLLQALALVKNSDPEMFRQIKCTVAGDGPLSASLKAEAVSRGVSDIVMFLGWVDRSETPALFARHGICAMPSFEEGMPNVILEAMASGHAVVATSIYGNDELVKDSANGILVKPADPLALADAIIRLVHDPALRERMGRESRRLALLRGWDIVAGRYNALICGR